MKGTALLRNIGHLLNLWVLMPHGYIVRFYHWPKVTLTQGLHKAVVLTQESCYLLDRGVLEKLDIKVQNKGLYSMYILESGPRRDISGLRNILANCASSKKKKPPNHLMFVFPCLSLILPTLNRILNLDPRLMAYGHAIRWPARPWLPLLHLHPGDLLPEKIYYSTWREIGLVSPSQVTHVVETEDCSLAVQEALMNVRAPSRLGLHTILWKLFH